jgi:hypothetical protein
MNLSQIIPMLFILFFSSIAGFAQCNTSVSITSSKTEYLDASMAVQRTVEEKTVIEISDSVITILPGNEENKMIGKIISKACQWAVPYKEGKSQIKAALQDGSGDTKNVTFSIEGKDGKVTFLAEVDEMPDQKVRVAADTFEAKK